MVSKRPSLGHHSGMAVCQPPPFLCAPSNLVDESHIPTPAGSHAPSPPPLAGPPHGRAPSQVFITGGDQSKYFDFWSESPVSDLVSKVPLVGGSSAGLAVLGRFVFDALHGG